jgi:hypothetical protein
VIPADEGEARAARSALLLGVFEQICQTVGYAHSAGIIHRDLKPLNVMVGAFGEVQVMDWGLARSEKGEGVPMRDDPEPAGVAGSDSSAVPHPSSFQTQPGQVRGTPAYMAPEQARGEGDRVGPRADVFALGGILCTILTGRPPFLGKSSAEAVRKAAAGDLGEAFHRLDACGADPELVALCRRCLAAEAAGRPENGKAVADAVCTHRTGREERLRSAERQRAAAEARAEEETNTRREAEARAAAEAAKATEQRRRRKVQRALFAAVLLLLAGGGAFAWWQDRKVRAEAERDRTEAQKAAQARRGVEESIPQGAALRKQFKFAEARALLITAADLARSNAPDLIAAVDQARADVEFARELDEIRFNK